MQTPPPLPPQPSSGDDVVTTLIPYKNGPALAAYYCGIFSLIPCVGMVLGIVAIVLGVQGLKKAKEYPQAKGKAHAWIGIVLGAGMVLLHIAVLLLAVVAQSQSR